MNQQVFVCTENFDLIVLGGKYLAHQKKLFLQSQARQHKLAPCVHSLSHESDSLNSLLFITKNLPSRSSHLIFSSFFAGCVYDDKAKEDDNFHRHERHSDRARAEKDDRGHSEVHAKGPAVVQQRQHAHGRRLEDVSRLWHYDDDSQSSSARGSRSGTTN